MASIVRQRFLLHAVDTLLQSLAVIGGFDLLVQVLDGAGKKAAGATGRVEDSLPELGVEHIDHELGDGAGGVVFARVPGRLQIGKDLFVDVVEQVTVAGFIEVHILFDGVDHLAQQGAGLHVVVGVLEDRADHLAMGRNAGGGGQFLERREEVIVDEVDQLFTGHPLGVLGPVGPAETAGQRRFVAGHGELPLLLLVVEDLQENQPDHLADALSVAIDADILAHDVLNGFDQGG
jgi:hypothetical protein